MFYKFQLKKKKSKSQTCYLTVAKCAWEDNVEKFLGICLTHELYELGYMVKDVFEYCTST